MRPVKFTQNKILIVGDAHVGVEYEEGSRRVGQRHGTDCSAKSILCPPDGQVDAMLYLPDDSNNVRIWASVIRADGSRQIVVYKNFEGDIVHKFPDRSGLHSTAGVVYEHRDGYSFGYDFLSDGRAMPFSLPFGSYDVRDTENESRMPGIPANVFVGCPQSFCWNVQFDDCMTYRGRIRIFSGPFFWDIVPGSQLPLPTPAPADAQELPAMHAYVDAVTETGTGDEFLLFKDDFVFFMKDERTMDKKMKIEEFLFHKKTGHPVDSIDAAWYNHNSKHLFVFRETHYYEMEMSADGSWKIVYPKERLIVADFKINVQDIDAVFTMNNKGILLKNNWFFTIPDTNFLYPSAAYAASLAMGSKADGSGLFDTKESCSMDETMFADLRHQMDSNYGLVDADEGGKRAMSHASADPSLPAYADPNAKRKSYETGSDVTVVAGGSSSRPVWPFIVVVLLVALILIFAVYCIWCRKAGPKSLEGV